MFAECTIQHDTKKRGDIYVFVEKQSLVMFLFLIRKKNAIKCCSNYRFCIMVLKFLHIILSSCGGVTVVVDHYKLYNIFYIILDIVLGTIMTPLA